MRFFIFISLSGCHLYHRCVIQLINLFHANIICRWIDATAINMSNKNLKQLFIKPPKKYVLFEHCFFLLFTKIKFHNNLLLVLVNFIVNLKKNKENTANEWNNGSWLVVIWGVWIIYFQRETKTKRKQFIVPTHHRFEHKLAHKNGSFHIMHEHAFALHCIASHRHIMSNDDRPESHISVSSCRYSFQQGIYHHLSHCSYLKAFFFFSLSLGWISQRRSSSSSHYWMWFFQFFWNNLMYEWMWTRIRTNGQRKFQKNPETKFIHSFTNKLS